MLAIPRSLPRWTPEEYRQRPRDLDPGLADQVCARVANGESLSEVCDDRDMPLPATFLSWARQDPEIGAAWRQAQVDRCDVLSEEMLVLSGGSDPHRARCEVDTRKFHVERGNPDKYGRRPPTAPRPPEQEVHVDHGAEVRAKLDAMARTLTRETVA